MVGIKINGKSIDLRRASNALGTNAGANVARYFRNSGDNRRLFTGRAFETLGINDPLRFTADDVVAVSTLSVNVPAHTAISLLREGVWSDEVNALLATIPRVAIWECEAERDLAAGSAADQLYRALKAEVGIDRVIATKLLARKRPHLLPIYDSVVAEIVLQRPKTSDWWLPMYEYMCDEGHRELLDEIRSTAQELLNGVDGDAAIDLAEISLLRIFDVALWMHGRS